MQGNGIGIIETPYVTDYKNVLIELTGFMDLP